MQLSSEHEIHHNLKNSEIDNQVGVGGGEKKKKSFDIKIHSYIILLTKEKK